MGELILYQTGKVQVKLRAEDDSVWLSQAELSSTTIPNANIHIRMLESLEKQAKGKSK
jgi:hypothetical protein